ncbi:hypothetical protein [Rhodanobacter sp. MP1X3]|uniref:hypothetical protein n=1 Tax=Rhodanobacter sp. MP1X3 TaxID=2723086 RepID=UPI001618D968|nr:hypothetical protein [Rhodanobacter sp. MP1X3]MBB6241945.1 hypothetical protein [Rhodanobacter sp. MP1X3]
MTQLFRYALGFAALAGFLISLAVHVEALMGVDIASSIPSVWLLHAGVFVVFGPFVFFSRKDFVGNQSLLSMAKGLPPWAAVLGGAIFVYAIVNFALFLLHSEGGNPTVENGKYLLMEHGALIRELTPTEFTALKANELRGFSGHWLLFYFVPAAYFLFWKPSTLPLSSGLTSKIA